MALGEMALESGDYAAARWYWERIVPVARTVILSKRSGAPEISLAQDDRSKRAAVSQLGPAIPIPTSTWPPCVPGWCWCRSSKARRSRARAELAELARLHPDARGRLGGQEGKYADLLQTLLAESPSWPPRRPIRTGPRLPAIPSGTRSRRDWSTSARWRGACRCVRGCRRRPRAGAANHRRRPARTAELPSVAGRQYGAGQR